ncbi:MAG: hypothetical protein GX350_01175 [Erysipelotrichaceae bacterium]|nr:hypothetical protein [Erysipelotrichaceae bacterium]
MDYSKEISKLIVELSEKIGKPLTSDDFYIQYQSLGHKPMPLPKDKIAVYTFVYMGQFLKIGQANSKSKARYQSHHYYIKSGKSTLANSLLKDKTMSTIVDSNNITQWIKVNCERFDVIMDAKLGKLTLNFIEGILHYKFNPKFEG